MGAPKSDIIELNKDYIPAKGEKIWLVFKPTWGWRMLSGRNWMHGYEATAALAKARRKLKDDFSDSYELGNKVKIVPATGDKIEEIHILLTGSGTPSVLFLIGLVVTVLGVGALAIVSDRVYKTVETAPLAVGMGMAGFLAMIGLGFMVFRKARPGA